MLSTTSQYAVRALCYLAKLREGEAILGRDLSEKAHIPANYLAKIMLALNKSGIVEATRGPHGGYRLRKPSASITLMDIALMFDGEAAVPDCLLQRAQRCSDDHPCPAHNAWKGVREVYIQFLRSTTIELISSNDVELKADVSPGNSYSL
ncbi:MAG: RrF2 family transcriptional regulator [Anaerolineales bacterium]